jgi:hypothetical protein
LSKITIENLTLVWKVCNKTIIKTRR